MQRGIVIVLAAAAFADDDRILERNNLAASHHQRGDYREAESLYRDAIRLAGATPRAAGVWHNLGELLKSTGRYGEAGRALERALELKRRNGSPADIARTTTSLADLARRRDRHPEAERLARQALVLLASSPSALEQRAQALNVLGLVEQALGRFDEAEQSLRRAAAAWEEHYGGPHPDAAVAWNNLGALYNAQGRYLDAVRITKQAVSIWEKTLGDGHPRVSAALTNLAGQQLRLGEYARAETTARRAVALIEQRYGPSSPMLVPPLAQLAEVARLRESPGEARAIYARCLEILAASEDRSLEGAILNSLGVLAYEQGSYEEAGDRLRRAARLFEARLGARHVETSIPRANLAAVYVALGRTAEAEPLLAHALEARRRALGEDHPLTAAAMAQRGDALRRLGRGREGDRAIARAREILSRHARENLQHHKVNLPAALGLMRVRDIEVAGGRARFGARFGVRFGARFGVRFGAATVRERKPL
jgi:tetratricopeptide (TPR) repeat protein